MDSKRERWWGRGGPTWRRVLVVDEDVVVCLGITSLGWFPEEKDRAWNYIRRELFLSVLGIREERAADPDANFFAHYSLITWP